MKMICYSSQMREKQSKKVRQFITQVGGNMKKIIKQILFILKECMEQHHKFERWDARNYKK